MRLDLLLVERKLATSRTQAQELIQSGLVFLKKADQNIPLLKSNFQVDEPSKNLIFVQDNLLQKFVSRGGLKLEQALAHVKLSVLNLKVLDIGQSTGGFTDCLIQHKAQLVVGIDVGHQQLHQKIRQLANVKFHEGLHVKDLSDSEPFLNSVPADKFDLVVGDVSFISLTKVMSFVKPYLKSQGHYLFLVKPQFELTAKDLDRNGVVKEPKKYGLVQSVIEQEARQQFGNVIDYFSSETPGKDGNQEFFIYGQKTQ